MAWLDKDVSLGLLEPSSKVVAEHLMKAKAGATFRRSITRNTGKHERRLDDESVKPLASYRAEELEVAPMPASTKARPATLSPERFFSIDWAKCATEASRAKPIGPPGSTFW
jgi:hypothetical protein